MPRQQPPPPRLFNLPPTPPLYFIFINAPPTQPPPQILKVDTERGAIVVKGSVPGKRGNILEIAPAKIVGRNC